MNVVTGRGVSIAEAALIAECIFNLQRLGNVRFGVSSADDVLPTRLFEPVDIGPLAGRKLPDLQPVLAEYCDRRGWDETGVPTDETVCRLGLADL